MMTLGFVPRSDQLARWKALGKEKTTFIRTFKHDTEPFWMEAHFLSSPKSVNRVLVTDKGSGRSAQTSDQQMDE